MKKIAIILLIAVNITNCKKEKAVPLVEEPNRTFIDARDNQEYKWVKIGDQVWMAENLKTTKYANGDDIITTNPASPVISTENSPRYQWAYNSDESNVDTYGRLYTWFVITDDRKLCPAGWHVSTDEDWTALSNFLGGDNLAGGKLKETGTEHWIEPNFSASNETSFSAVPGGYRYQNGVYYGKNYTSSFWTSTAFDGNSAFTRKIENSKNILDKGTELKKFGAAVRCVKD